MSNADQQKAKNPMGPANPQALNCYSYLLNNPLNYNDPTGHLLVVDDCGGGGGAGVVVVTVVYVGWLYLTQVIVPAVNHYVAEHNNDLHNIINFSKTPKEGDTYLTKEVRSKMKETGKSAEAALQDVLEDRKEAGQSKPSQQDIQKTEKQLGVRNKQKRPNNKRE